MFGNQPTYTMATIHIDYSGNLRTDCTHLQSGTHINTDAPTDNQGRGEAFSPTDLVANALGTCIITTMAIFARRDGIELAGSTLSVTKIMTTQPPRRIARIEVSIPFRPTQCPTKPPAPGSKKLHTPAPSPSACIPTLNRPLLLSGRREVNDVAATCRIAPFLLLTGPPVGRGDDGCSD